MYVLLAAATTAYAAVALQWVTHAFCHANWTHLSMNAFNLVVFGKVRQQRLKRQCSGMLYQVHTMHACCPLADAVTTATARVRQQGCKEVGAFSIARLT